VVAGIGSTFVTVVTIDGGVDTARITVARVFSTIVVIFTVYFSKVYTSFFTAMEFRTMIFISIFNRSVNTTNFSIASIISASVVIVTDYKSGNTTNIRVTTVGITFIIKFTSIRSISNNASLFFIAGGIMTIIRSHTLRGNIGIYTSLHRATGIFSTRVIIVTYDIFIFTWIGISTGRITSINGTFIIIITIYSAR
jgi:hypothetical protein